MYVLENTGKTLQAKWLLVQPQTLSFCYYLQFHYVHNLICNLPGDFVKQNGLEIGDSLTLYEDESKNLVSLSFIITMILVIKILFKN